MRKNKLVKYTDKFKIGDCFLVRSGANALGTGKQIAIVMRRTKKNAYCCKFSIRQYLKMVAINYKLDPERIIEKVPLMSIGLDKETRRSIEELNGIQRYTEFRKQGVDVTKLVLKQGVPMDI